MSLQSYLFVVPVRDDRRRIARGVPVPERHRFSRGPSPRPRAAHGAWRERVTLTWLNFASRARNQSRINIRRAGLSDHLTIDAIGFAAAGLVLATFCMRSMSALRWVALASNVTFMVYAYMAHLPPVLLLHALLLPVNAYRLTQLSAKRADEAERGPSITEMMATTRCLRRQGARAGAPAMCPCALRPASVPRSVYSGTIEWRNPCPSTRHLRSSCSLRPPS